MPSIQRLDGHPARDPSGDPARRPPRFRALPGSIWALGFVSLFMDTSSELVHSLLPAFLCGTMGASVAMLGVIEGIAEAVASAGKVFSGMISDHFRRRKGLVLLGYGLAALTKPLFPLATSISWVFTARFVDRIGKGIRGAPRDALVADLVPANARGAAYGLRQALDSVGAFLGPALAVVFMAGWADDVRSVLWVAVLPALLCVGLIVFGVREPEFPDRGPRAGRAPIFAGGRGLPGRYWRRVALGAVFTMARFSEAFLVLRAQDVGLRVGLVPLVMIVMNVVYAAVAYPAGAAADRLAPRPLLVTGLGLLIIADGFLALAWSPAFVFIGALFWGLHMACTQGLFSKLVADAAPAELRGTAFGIYNLVNSGALLLASALAGGLWATAGPVATFLAGGFFATVAATGLLLPLKARA